MDIVFIDHQPASLLSNTPKISRYLLDKVIPTLYNICHKVAKVETAQLRGFLSKSRKGFIMTTSNLKVTTTDFEYNYHYSEKHGNNNEPDYIRHNLDIYNELMGFSAVYQSGQSYYHGDYSLPSTKVELSDGGGTDPVLLKVNALYESDIDNMSNEDMNEFIESLNCTSIKTREDVRTVYLELMDNNSRADQYAQSLDIEPVFQ